MRHFNQQHCKNCDSIEEHELIEIMDLYWLQCQSCLESTPLGEKDVHNIIRERTMKTYRVTIERNGERTHVDVEARGTLAAIQDVRAQRGKAVSVVDVELLRKVDK